MSPAEVAAELDAELLRRMWALFDAAKAMCQGGEWEPEVWERLIRAVADVPESARGAALRAEPSEQEVERAYRAGWKEGYEQCPAIEGLSFGAMYEDECWAEYRAARSRP